MDDIRLAPIAQLIRFLEAKDLNLATDAEIASLIQLGLAALEVQDRRKAEYAERRRQDYQRRGTK